MNFTNSGGANDHMTNHSKLLTDFYANTSSTKVILIDGSTSFVLGFGIASPISFLSHMFWGVPRFFFNLLYVIQLTCALIFCVLFFLSHCLE